MTGDQLIIGYLCVLATFLVPCCLGLGFLFGSIRIEKEAVERGYAHFDQDTGRFTWGTGE